MLFKKINHHENIVKEIYKNSKQEMNIIDTLDKRERWVVNYIILTIK